MSQENSIFETYNRTVEILNCFREEGKNPNLGMDYLVQVYRKSYQSREAFVPDDEWYVFNPIDDVISSEISMDEKTLNDIKKCIEDNDVMWFCELCDYCLDHRREWLKYFCCETYTENAISHIRSSWEKNIEKHSKYEVRVMKYHIQSMYNASLSTEFLTDYICHPKYRALTLIPPEKIESKMFDSFENAICYFDERAGDGTVCTGYKSNTDHVSGNSYEISAVECIQHFEKNNKIIQPINRIEFKNVAVADMMLPCFWYKCRMSDMTSFHGMIEATEYNDALDEVRAKYNEISKCGRIDKFTLCYGWIDINGNVIEEHDTFYSIQKE